MSTVMENETYRTSSPGANGARIGREAARAGADTATASIEAGRTLLDETNRLGHLLFTTWWTQGESALKTLFDGENLALDTYLSLFDAASKRSREALEEASRVVRDTETATLEAWRTGMAAVDRSFDVPGR